MPPDDPTPLRGNRRSLAGMREGPPSPAAQARLAGALRDRAVAYRQNAAVDLTIIEALLRLDEAEAAAKTLDEHRASLHAMAHDLQVVVADAAVEREAEAVCHAVVEELAPRRDARPTTGLRRRVLALTGAAAVLIALALPAARFSPRTTLASIEGRSAGNDLAAARERLEVAKSQARALRADTTPPAVMSSVSADTRAAAAARRDARVAKQVRTILAADATGGSAAHSSSQPAEVTDLEAYRASRRAGEPSSVRDGGDDTKRHEEGDDPAPSLEAPVPQPGTPTNLQVPDTGVDTGAVVETDALLQ